MSAGAARWIVPVAVTALAVGGGVAASASSDATPDLPERSAEDLLLAVSEAEPVPFSGTVRTVADLGLPDLGALAGQGGSSATDPTSAFTRLLTGENQLRVWVGGPEQQRVSLVDDFAELDVIRNGDEAWTYSSTGDVATRYDLAEIAARAQQAHERAVADGEVPAESSDAERDAGREQALAPYEDLTPSELARLLLAEADPSTEVAVGETQVVAGRDAYTLTATPRDEATLVGTVEVAVDAETGLVLQVEVGARDQATPALATGFTALDLSAPAADVFEFTPAPGTTVVDGLEEAESAAAEAEARGPGEGLDDADRAELEAELGAELEAALADAPEPVVHGEGWSTAVELTLPTAAGADHAGADTDPQALLGQLSTEVDGGTVFTSALLTVLLTDDGRVLLGSVDTATLQSYAG